MAATVTELDGPLRQEFESILCSLFGDNTGELRQHLSYEPQASSLVTELPGPSASMSALVHASVTLLLSHGRLSEPGFFERLIARRPLRGDEIRAIRQRISGENSSPGEAGRTHVLVFRGQFPQQPTLISLKEIRDALRPIQPIDEPEWLDWPPLDARDLTAWRAGLRSLHERVGQFIDAKVRPSTEGSVSVFALGPTPWLIALGDRLGDAIPVRIYGRLREPEGWHWQSSPESETALRVERRGPTTKVTSVALLLSISARISRKEVDAVLPRPGRALFEVSLERPRPDAIRTEAQLREFAEHARTLFYRIFSGHTRDRPIHVFAAAPAPVLLALGRALPHRVARQVHLHDYSAREGFSQALPLYET
ncbi:SAVED domain-containing protein [Nannocystis bainbridge]|uniref:SAVED domain-containing protein n=1 Tax=Nannocystis bainbridge TaxID=2995303 RepID=A0ABT5DWH7_9BACT|nr:SAVED domain-containing protein [Nannocystis bainbridge]MDC0717500.1 SAVED domain-containing protein [Nannocystis bainbridge]